VLELAGSYTRAFLLTFIVALAAMASALRARSCERANGVSRP
jgi:hypothetical protein